MQGERGGGGGSAGSARERGAAGRFVSRQGHVPGLPLPVRRGRVPVLLLHLLLRGDAARLREPRLHPVRPEAGAGPPALRPGTTPPKASCPYMAWCFRMGRWRRKICFPCFFLFSLPPRPAAPTVMTWGSQDAPAPRDCCPPLGGTFPPRGPPTSALWATPASPVLCPELPQLMPLHLALPGDLVCFQRLRGWGDNGRLKGFFKLCRCRKQPASFWRVLGSCHSGSPGRTGPPSLAHSLAPPPLPPPCGWDRLGLCSGAGRGLDGSAQSQGQAPLCRSPTDQPRLRWWPGRVTPATVVSCLTLGATASSAWTPWWARGPRGRSRP